MKRAILAIDTSNYTTSVAVTDREGEILLDLRRLLSVKEGKKGLRQSEALFQHVQALPELLEEAFRAVSASELAALAFSARPRPQEGSYMPCFLPGGAQARALAAALELPLFSFSHQEGHFAAAARGTALEDASAPYLAYHLSGGTCELILVSEGTHRIVGGSLDISAGQLLDRLGVALGLPFPCGASLDRMALEHAEKADMSLLAPIPLKGAYANLSGIETQALRRLAEGAEPAALLPTVFRRLSAALLAMAKAAAAQSGCEKVLFAGGVSSSEALRRSLPKAFAAAGLSACFGEKRLMTDNAVGTALLGGRREWQ